MNNDMSIISNCVLCNKHSLHIIGEKEYESQAPHIV